MAESLFDFTVTQLNGKPVSDLWVLELLVLDNMALRITTKLMANFFH